MNSFCPCLNFAYGQFYSYGNRDTRKEDYAMHPMTSRKRDEEKTKGTNATDEVPLKMSLK